MWFYHRVMHPEDADRMENSVDPDQTAPAGSALFAQTSLSNEPRPDKTNKVTVCPAKTDQPGHLLSLIRVFTVHLMGS